MGQIGTEAEYEQNAVVLDAAIAANVLTLTGTSDVDDQTLTVSIDPDGYATYGGTCPASLGGHCKGL